MPWHYYGPAIGNSPTPKQALAALVTNSLRFNSSSLDISDLIMFTLGYILLIVIEQTRIHDC